MLLELMVRNLVIVEDATLEFGAGFTVISGETGAGKSLLLEALGLILGDRGGAALIGPQGESTMVSAVFAPPPGVVAAIRAACGIDDEEGRYILRRRLADGGRSQAWINDVPVAAKVLREVGDQLVEIRVQHEHLRIRHPTRQLELIDTSGRLLPQAEAYRQAHSRVLTLRRQLTDLESGTGASLRELDFCSHLLREIDAADPQPGELERLEERHRFLSGIQAWRALAAEAVEVLGEGPQAAVTTLGRLGKRLVEAPDPALAAAGQACLDAAERAQEAVVACAGALERMDADPGQTARIESRLDLLHDLMRKHGGSEASLLTARGELAQRVADLQGLDGRRDQVVADLAAAAQDRDRLGADLAAARRKAFAQLTEATHRHLAEMGMPKARLSLAERTAEPTADGTVQQEIAVLTNPGLPPGPLGAIASGGESARLTLALAAALAEADPTPVLVFDEVDTGVGGRIGAAIGRKLSELGRHRSVIAVTHTPQLAAWADRQLVVRKQQEDTRTTVRVAPLTGRDRIDEIAEMLGGGEAARKQARALLNEREAGA